MNPWNRDATAVQSQSTAVDQGLRSYMLRVYNYMASGVLLSAVVAYFAGTSPAVLQLLLTQNSSGGAGLSALGLAAVFSPLVMVFVFMARARTMSAGGLQAYFWTYAGLVGLSMFSIFLVYTQLSILRVFLTTAATFGLFSIYGYTTKRDLSSWGSFLIVGIWAIIGVSLVNMFLLHSSGVNLMLSYAGGAARHRPHRLQHADAEEHLLRRGRQRAAGAARLHPRRAEPLRLVRHPLPEPALSDGQSPLGQSGREETGSGIKTAPFFVGGAVKSA